MGTSLLYKNWNLRGDNPNPEEAVSQFNDILYGDRFEELKGEFDMLPATEWEEIGTIFDSDADFIGSRCNGQLWLEELQEVEDFEKIQKSWISLNKKVEEIRDAA